MYSMFPAGVPGLALLLLRVTASAAVSLFALGQQGLGPAKLRLGVCCVSCGLMCLGLLTPICSGVVAAMGAITMCIQWRTQSAIVWLWVAILLCISMLGPGRFSLDARLFGRKIIRSPLDKNR